MSKQVVGGVSEVSSSVDNGDAAGDTGVVDGDAVNSEQYAAGESAGVDGAGVSEVDELSGLLGLDSADRERIAQVRGADVDESVVVDANADDGAGQEQEELEESADVEADPLAEREDDPHGVRERLSREREKHERELAARDAEIARLRGEQQQADAGGVAADAKRGAVDPVAGARTMAELEAVQQNYQDVMDQCFINLDGWKDFAYVDKDGQQKVKDLDAAQVKQMLVETTKKLRELPKRAQELAREQAVMRERAAVSAKAKEVYPDVFDAQSEGSRVLLSELGNDVLDAVIKLPGAAFVLGDFLAGRERRLKRESRSAGRDAGVSADADVDNGVVSDDAQAAKQSPNRRRSAGSLRGRGDLADVVSGALSGDVVPVPGGGGRSDAGVAAGRQSRAYDRLSSGDGSEADVVASLAAKFGF